MEDPSSLLDTKRHEPDADQAKGEHDKDDPEGGMSKIGRFKVHRCRRWLTSVSEIEQPGNGGGSMGTYRSHGGEREMRWVRMSRVMRVRWRSGTSWWIDGDGGSHCLFEVAEIVHGVVRCGPFVTDE